MNEPLNLTKYHKGIHPRCNICKIEEDIKSAIGWYKKYLDSPIGYFNKFPEQLNEFWKHIDVDDSIMIIEETYLYKETFNTWLINKAFPDLCPSGDLIADKQNPQIDDKPCKVCNKPLTAHSRFYDNHTYEPAD